MNQLVNWLAPHLPLAVATLTLLLAIGCACVALTRSPAHRQRIGELTIAGALIWLVLALIPLPRLLPRSLASTELQDAGAPRLARMEFPASAPQGHRLLPLSPLPAASSADEQTPLAAEATPDIPILPSESSVATQVEPSHSAIGEPNRVADFGRDLPADFEPHVVADVPTIHPPRAVAWEVATWICLAGAVAGLCWLMLGHALLIRERFTAAPPPAWLFRLFQRADGSSSAEGRLPKLVVSRSASRPLTWGIFRPTIALPARLCHRGNYEQLRTILLHELAHVRRGDARGSLLFELAFPLLLLHPLYWWLRQQVRLSAELLADDWAARQTGPEVYVAQLVALARGTSLRRLSLVFGTGVLTNPSQFYRRMKMLLAREKPLSSRLSMFWRLSSASAAVVAVVLAAALAGNNSVAADEPTKPAAIEVSSPAPEVPQPAAADVPSVDAAELPKPGTSPVEPQASVSSPAETKPEAAPGAPRVPILPTVETQPVAVNKLPPATPKPSDDPRGVPGLTSLPVVGRLFTSGSADNAPATVEGLQAEREQLRAQLNALQARLDQIERADAKAGSPPGSNGQPAKVVQLTHPEKNGQLTVETWTVDEKGHPDRIVSKTQVASDSPITSASPGKVDGNVVVKEFRDKSGNRWIHSYQITSDGSVGKLIESRVVAGNDALAGAQQTEPVQPPAVSTASPSPEKVPYPGRNAPSIFAPQAVQLAKRPGSADYTGRVGGDTGGPVVSTRPLDLIALATSYADAVGAVDMAKAKLAEAEQNLTDKEQPRQLNSHRVGLESAVRKEKLLRRIAQVAANGAKQEFERAVRLHATGAIAAEEMEEIKARLEILEHILGANDSETGNNSPKP
jgi:beta-lactamase regulating signal transducer with metallopeptidase domain